MSASSETPHLNISDLSPIPMPFQQSHASDTDQSTQIDGIIKGPFTNADFMYYAASGRLDDIEQLYIKRSLWRNRCNRSVIALQLRKDPEKACRLTANAGTPAFTIGNFKTNFITPIIEALATDDPSTIIHELHEVGYKLHNSGSRITWFDDPDLCFIILIGALQHPCAGPTVVPILFELWRLNLMNFQLFVEHGGDNLLEIVQVVQDGTNPDIPPLAKLNISKEEFREMKTYLEVACEIFAES